MSRICVVTGTRAEYGLLRPVIRRLAALHKVTILVTGMHLSAEFGSTWREIEADDLAPRNMVEILLANDSDVAVCKAMGLGLIGFGEYFARSRPALLVGLGDRFELLAAVSAAVACRVPVAHIHGGELTEGAFDEAFRHAITKMSHLHFTSTEAYRRRVLQMGEAADRVFNVGAPGLDNIREMEWMERGDLERDLGVTLGPRNLLITFHPVTLEAGQAVAQLQQLLDALDRLAGTHLFFTRANADPEGRAINLVLDSYAARTGASVFTSLGTVRYLSLMREVDAVVGNSSSGLIEAPGLGVPTVNIGDRQHGRVRAASVIDCAPTTDAIEEALRRALSDDFRRSARTAENPYGDGRSAERIARHIGDALGRGISVRKPFVDLPD